MGRLREVLKGARSPWILGASLVVVLGSLTAGVMASASTGAGKKPVPWPAPTQKIFMYVDTDSAATQGVYGDCEQGNLFQPGQQVLFRASAALASTGATLQPTQVREFDVIIPGSPATTIPMVFMAHTFGVETGAAPPEYWTGVWKIPTTYPLGVVNFSVKLVTRSKPSVSVTWHQIPITAADLTVVTSSVTTTTTTSVPSS